MNATRKTFGLAKVLAVFISLQFACTLLMSSVCAPSAFAGTTDEALLGTMTIQLDSSEPDNPNLDPDNPNPDDNGNGDNGDGSGSYANNGDGNNGNLGDEALKASAYNGKNGKGFLSNTGDVVSTVLIALFALSAIFLGCVYLSRRRAMSASGVDSTFKTTNISRLRTAFVAMLAATLIAGGVLSALKAFADGDVTDAGSSNAVDATSTVIVDKDGNIKSTSITLQNKLKTPVTVKSIFAPTELSNWTSTIDANTEIAAEGKTSGTWNTADGKIPDSILEQLSEDNPSIELSFESEVSYTSYDVTWSANGGNGVFDTTPVPANGNVVLPANEPTREHYTFAGWNKDADGNGEEVTENTIVTGDVTFYAKWTPETYAISYEFPDGGEFAGGVTPEDSYTYGVGVDSFEEPYKQGYDFDGWYDAETGGNKVTSISTTDFGDKTLYARWTPGTNTKYVVKHYLQNIEDDEYSYNIGGDVELAGTTGEDTTATAKSLAGFEPVLPIKQKKIAADGSTVVRVNYNRIKYTVSFNLNGKGGSTRWDPQTVKYGGYAITPILNPVTTGFTFGGWYSNQGCIGNSFDFENTQITKDMTLYAKWIAKTYTVKFDKNDASATGTMQDQTFTFDVAQKLTACTFKKTDATFLGWAEASDGEVKYTDAKEVKNLSSTGGETITLYAKWQTVFTVTYDATGGTGSPVSGVFKLGYTDNATEIQTSNVKVKANGALLEPDVDEQYSIPVVPSPNTDGYVFDGWYTQPKGNGEKVEIGTTEITENVTYYAKYVEANIFFTSSVKSTDPRSIALIKYPIEYLKMAADDLRENTTNSVYYAQFSEWMTNDSYHLYTLLKGTDGSYLDPTKKDSWAEFRVIGVGQHEGDGSGLTFQMVHGLPNAYKFDSTGATGANLNWEKSTLRKSMLENGSIYNLFDSDLIDAIRPVEKKYNTTAGSSIGVATTTDKLWILSYTEYTNNVNTKYWTEGQLGITYSYWASKNVVSDNEDASKYPEIVALCKTRSGGKISTETIVHSNAFQRSVSPNKNNTALLLGTTAYLGSFDNGYSYPTHAVDVAFAM